MKKLLAILIIISTCLLTFFSCKENDDTTTMRIGYMAGPTGMGLSKLISDTASNGLETAKYTFEKFTDTEKATAALTAGNIDAICIPTSDAAKYYNTVDDSNVVLAINTLNTLFVLTDKGTTVSSFAELEGKTIYTCKNGTPKIILDTLLKKAGVNATVSTSVDGKEIKTPQQLGEQVIAGNVSIAVVPEPIVTSSMLAIKKNGNTNIEYSIDLNLNDAWVAEYETEIAMGCIVASRSFVREHKSVVDRFLREYKVSVEYVSDITNIETSAEYVVNAGVLQALPAAKTALKNLSGSIVYIDGKNMKNTLKEFYKAIGMTSPDENFYYEK